AVDDIRPIELPHRNAALIRPQDIGETIVVKIAGRFGGPVGADEAVEDGGSRQRTAVDGPDGDLAAVIPDVINLAVAADVRSTNDVPVGADRTGGHVGSGNRDRVLPANEQVIPIPRTACRCPRLR